MDLSAQTADTGYNQRYLLKETEMRQLLKRVTAMLLAVILAAGTGSIWYVPAASLKTRGGGQNEIGSICLVQERIDDTKVKLDLSGIRGQLTERKRMRQCQFGMNLW